MADALARLPIPGRLLAALLLLLGALMLPHAANLDPTVVLFFYAAMLWRLVAIRHPHWLPGRWLLFLLMLGAMMLVFFSTGVVDGRLTGTALLVAMLGLKLLELKARRDIHVTVFLGYFLVLTLFLYSQALALAIYLFAGVLALIAIQVGLNRVEVSARGQLRNTVAMIGAALPLALVLFLVFPRLQSPLWGINAASAITGISNEMTLGNIGDLTRSGATAFRVRFLDPPPEPAARYWRGPVLWETDGRNWRTGRRLSRPITPAVSVGGEIAYEVMLEPTGQYWLFGLDVVTQVPAGTRLTNDYALVAENRVNRRFSYQAASDPAFRPDGLDRRERDLGLQLPPEVSPRVRALVRSWEAEAEANNPFAVVERALAYFRDQPFVYTLTPGVIDGDPIDGFLFETRRGFCEHYAGSFALLMRLAGVPSRVVIGYQGGEKNPHADHWVVRQSDAHAWTEVWIPELGWWRVDPTAAVAPQRVEQSIDPVASLSGDAVMFQVDARGPLVSLWRDAAWLVDAIDLGWHRWVVGFTAERQENLFQRIGLGRLDGIGLAAAMLVGGALAAALGYLLARLPTPRREDPLPALWRRFKAKLARGGVELAGWQGPDTVCARARARYPAQAEELTAIARLYVQLRYGRRRDPTQVTALRRRIRRLSLKRQA